MLPASIAPDTTCPTPEGAQRFRGLCAVGVHAAQAASSSQLLRGLGLRNPTITQKWWADDRRRRSGSTPKVKQLARDVQARRRRAVPDAVAPVRLSPGDRRCSSGARAHARRRAPPLQHAQLRRPAAHGRARCCATTPTCGRRCSRNTAGCSWTSSRTRTPSRPRSCSCCASRPKPDATAAGPAHARGLATVPLRPGALFVVGDPKQSIYRFRRADIDIYNEVRERLGSADGRRRAAHDQLPFGAGAVRVGERGYSSRGSRRRTTPHAPRGCEPRP